MSVSKRKAKSLSVKKDEDCADIVARTIVARRVKERRDIAQKILDAIKGGEVK